MGLEEEVEMTSWKLAMEMEMLECRELEVKRETEAVGGLSLVLVPANLCKLAVGMILVDCLILVNIPNHALTFLNPATVPTCALRVVVSEGVAF